MSAMEMPYKLDNPQLIEGIKPGDQIRGRLEVRGPDYVLPNSTSAKKSQHDRAYHRVFDPQSVLVLILAVR